MKHEACTGNYSIFDTDGVKYGGLLNNATWSTSKIDILNNISEVVDTFTEGLAFELVPAAKTNIRLIKVLNIVDKQSFRLAKLCLELDNSLWRNIRKEFEGVEDLIEAYRLIEL